MKRTLILFLLLIPFAVYSYSQNSYRSLADSLKYVVDVPYIHNCNDPVLWKVVEKGLDIVPNLIDKMDDTTILKEAGYVPFFSGEYTVADVAHVALLEIIRDIPTFELLGVEFDEKGCGYCSYWFHVRAKVKNRKRFKEAVRKWYDYHKNYLEWTEGNGMSNTGDCFMPLTLKGHYRVKKTAEDFLAEILLNSMVEEGNKVYVNVYKDTSIEYSNSFERTVKFSKSMPKEGYLGYNGWFVSTKEDVDLLIVNQFAEFKGYAEVLRQTDEYKWDTKAPAFWSKRYKNLVFIDFNKINKDVKKKGYIEVSLPAFSRKGEYATVTVSSYTPYIYGSFQVYTTDHIYKREDNNWVEIAYRVREVS